MKYLRIIPVSFSLITCASIYFGCDDAGTIIPRNDATFTQTNMKTLNPQTEGMYEAWVSFSNLDHPDSLYVSLGKFNISASGQTVDEFGNPKALKLKYHPTSINSAEDAIVTVELPGDNDTIPGTRLLGGTVTQNANYITANVDMKYPEALGTIAESFSGATAGVIMNTPTSLQNPPDYYKGLWFCDTLQNSLFGNLLVMPSSSRWIYEGWVLDMYDSIYYSTGKFSNPDSVDSDGAGQYSGPLLPYLKPGEDWVSYQHTPEFDLRSNYIQVFVTLEPKNEIATLTPFFLRIFFKFPLGNLAKGEIVGLDNVSSTLPTAVIQVSKQ